MTAPALRQYQLDAIQRTRLAASQSRTVLVVSPTGSGKTTIASEIARSAVSRSKRVLWLAHRSELIEQGFDRLREFGLAVGAIAATNTRPPNPYAPVQVASIQTLLARPATRPDADLVIWDEVHHSVSDEWSALAQFYSTKTLLGFTATPERSDGKGLGAIFQRLVVAARVQELVEMGHLVPCDIRRPSRRLKPGTIAQRPVDAYLSEARGRRTICFSPSVGAANVHAEEFNGLGIRARVITGDMPAAERGLYLGAFKRGDIDVLVNVYVLTEGFDCPETSCVILARGCGTTGVYLQMTGRGLRPAHGKKDCLLIDLHGVSHVHGHPQDDREYSLDGKGIRRAGDMEVDPQGSCRVCGAPTSPGEACAECGTAPKQIEPPKVTGDPLEKYAKKRAEDNSQKAATYARWIADAIGKGYRVGAAKGKFKAVYGEWPSVRIEMDARAILNGEKKEKVA